MDAHKNLAVSTVATAPSPAASGTSLVVASGEGTRFPAVPFNATVWADGELPDPTNAEIVRVTAISTDTLTIARAQEGTSARTIGVGDRIAATITAKTLADIEGALAPLIVTSLPSSPTDGDEVYLRVGTGDSSVLWHLRYDASVTDSYKWRFIGGSPIVGENGTASIGAAGGSTSASGTYVELDLGEPKVTIPYTGVYDVSFGAQMGATAATAYALVGLKINGANPANDNEDIEFRCNAGSASWTNASRRLRKTIADISTSADIKQVYRTDGNTNRFTQRWISVVPVRIG